MVLSEQERLKRILEGDTESFRWLVNHYQKQAFSIALSVLRHQPAAEEEAKEVVQDAFLLVYRGLPNFRMEARFSTWLFRIVVREAWKKNKRLRENPPTQILDTVHELPFSTQDGGMLVLEKKQILRTLMNQLTAAERLVLDLHYFHEESLVEISKITGYHVPHVKVLLHRGRKRLASLVPPYLRNEWMNNL